MIGVYKIYNDDFVYIGSSFTVEKRRVEHKSNCTNDKSCAYHYQLYRTIRDNGGWTAFSYEILETVSNLHITKAQLQLKEQFYMDELQPNMNSIRAFTDKEQRMEYNRQQSRKFYRNPNNRESVRLYQKEYRLKQKLA